MNKILLLLLGVCLAQAALRQEDLIDKVFAQGREYVYRYSGEVKTGVPKSSDRFAGIKIESDVRLQFMTDQDILMVMENIKLKSLRGELESPPEKELRKMTRKTSKEIVSEQLHMDAFREDHFSSSEKWFMGESSSSERRETKRMEENHEHHQEQHDSWKQQQISSEEQRRPKETERRSEEERRRSSQQESRESQEDSSRSASREEGEEIPDQEMEELRRALKRPIRVRYVDGKVEKIEAEKDDPQWSMNIKRALLNMLQITRNPKNSEILDKDAREATSNVAFDKSRERLFRIMEPDVSGECETQYHIRDSQQEQNVQVVTKTKDLENCRHRPLEYVTFMSGRVHRTNMREKHIQSVVQTRMRVISDRSRSERFLIQQADCRGEQVFRFYSEKGGDIIFFIKQILQLTEAKSKIEEQDKIPEPSQPEQKGNLTFVFEKKTPQGSFPHESREQSQESFVERKEKINRLCDELSRGLKKTISKEAPKTFIKLVMELRQLSAEQLKEVYQEKIPMITKSSREQTTEEQDSETRKLLVDAFSMTGTEEALKALKDGIEEKGIMEGEALKLLAGISLSINPTTPKSAGIMLEIAKSKQIAENKELRKTAWLAFGTMVHRLEAQTQQKAETIQLKREYARQLLSGVGQKESDEEKMVCLKAIGNAGLEDTVDRLQEIISGKDSATASTEIRIQAIYALRRVARKLPHKVRNCLYPVFKNPVKSAEERIAAFIVMIESRPEESFLELLAQSTQRETSNQVGGFVYTHMKSLAESRMPVDRAMSKKCQKALRLCRPFDLGIQYSHSSKWQAMDDSLEVGASVDLQTVSDKRSVLPRAATAKLNVQALGYNVNLLETGVRATGVQTMVDSLYRSNKNKKSVFDNLKKKSQHSSQEYRDSPRSESRQRTLQNIEAEKIQSQLNIKTRREEDPSAQIYLKVFGNEVTFQNIDSALLKQIVREDSLAIPDIEQQLREGLEMKMTKAHHLAEGSLGIPTTLGLPIYMTMNSLVLTKSEISGQMTVSPRLFHEDRPSDQKDVRAIEASLSSTHSIAMQTTGAATIDCHVIKSGFEMDISMNSVIPIPHKITVDLKNRQHKLTFETPEKEVDLLKLKARPIVFTEEKTSRKGSDSRQVTGTLRKEIPILGRKIQKSPSQMNLTWGRQVLGVEYQLESSMISRVNKEKTAPFQPFCGPVELRLSARPGENRPKEVEISVEQTEVPASSSERSEEQKKAQRLDINIIAKNERQPRQMSIKIRTEDEQVEEDPRRRRLDSREDKIPRKFLVRSPREKEPETSAETQSRVRQQNKQQTRRSISIVIDRSRIPQLESWDTKFCANAVVQYPTNRDDRLIQDNIVSADVDAKWGADCSGRGPRVWINAKWQKSVQQRREERREEAAEWESSGQYSKKGLTQSQEHIITSILKSFNTLWMGEESDSKSVESHESSERAYSASIEQSQRSRESSSEESRERKQSRNLYRQCLRDRRDGQRYSRSCQEAVRLRSQLRELDIEIMAQKAPGWLRQWKSAVRRYLQHIFYDRTSIDEDLVMNPEGLIRVRATVDAPEKEMNVTLRFPGRELNITRVPLQNVPLWFPSTRNYLTEQVMDRITKNKYTPYCNVQANDKIRTFDEVEYKYRIGKCDHVLAKDASPDEKFLVLVSKPEVQRPEKTVKGTKVELIIPHGTTSQESIQPISQESQKSREIIEGRAPSKGETSEREPSQPSSRHQSQDKGARPQTSSSREMQSGSSSSSESYEFSSSEEKMHEHKPVQVTIDGREQQLQPNEVRKIRQDSSPHSKVICTLRRRGNTVELRSPEHGLTVKVDGHNVQVLVSHDYRSKLAGLCGNFDGEQTNEYEGPREEIYKSPKEFCLSYMVPSKQCKAEGRKQPVMRNIMITRLNDRNEEQACFSKTPVAQCPEDSKKAKSEVRSMEFHCLPKELQSTQKMIKLHKTKPLGDKLQGKSTDLVQDVEAELECREEIVQQ